LFVRIVDEIGRIHDTHLEQNKFYKA